MTDNHNKLDEAWDQAYDTGMVIDIGPVVLCDLCNKDYTTSDEVGGFVFGSYSVCPSCCPDFLCTIIACNEEGFIAARCGENESFKDFILKYRGGNNTIQIIRI